MYDWESITYVKLVRTYKNVSIERWLPERETELLTFAHGFYELKLSRMVVKKIIIKLVLNWRNITKTLKTL